MAKERAEWVYKAFGDARHWRDELGQPLLEWQNQPEEIKRLWRAAVDSTLLIK